MKKYYKKSDTFTAIKFDGENIKEVVEFLEGTRFMVRQEHYSTGSDFSICNLLSTSERLYTMSADLFVMKNEDGDLSFDSNNEDWVEIQDEPRGSADV